MTEPVLSPAQLDEIERLARLLLEADSRYRAAAADSLPIVVPSPAADLCNARVKAWSEFFRARDRLGVDGLLSLIELAREGLAARETIATNETPTFRGSQPSDE